MLRKKIVLLGLILSIFSPTTAFSKLKGFADIHNHMMAEYSFGGAWLWGSHTGPEDVALKSCSGNRKGAKDHSRTNLFYLNEIIGKSPGSKGDTGLHLKKTEGFPSYKGWPRWDTIGHQRVWEGHLKKAHRNGLSLVVISIMDFKQLCDVMPKKNLKYSCDSSKSVLRQIQATKELDQKHNWLQVVRSPKEAREVISKGKLAVVLAIEVSDLFDKGNWREQLNRYYDLGIRSIQPVHQLNNRFGGTAPHHKIFQILEKRKEKKVKYDKLGKNILGLTKEGKALVKEMIKKKMIVDVSHLSERGVRDAWKIMSQTTPRTYPLFISHGHFRHLVTDKKQKEEKTTPDWIAKLVSRSGGMFGIRTGHIKTKSYGHVKNNCDGSSRSFAQFYHYGRDKLKLNVAIASDFNGFIQQIRPRFGNKKEACGAGKNKRIKFAQQRLQKKRLGTKFDRIGLGSVEQLPDFLADLRLIDVDTKMLDESSETFVRMWERVEEVR